MTKKIKVSCSKCEENITGTSFIGSCEHILCKDCYNFINNKHYNDYLNCPICKDRKCFVKNKVLRDIIKNNNYKRELKKFKRNYRIELITSGFEDDDNQNVDDILRVLMDNFSDLVNNNLSDILDKLNPGTIYNIPCRINQFDNWYHFIKSPELVYTYFYMNYMYQAKDYTFFYITWYKKDSDSNSETV